MPAEFSKTVLFQELAERRVTLAGNLLTEDCPRLAAMLADTSADPFEVHAELAFALDDENVPIVDGTLQAAIPLTCSRCLEPVSIALESSFQLQIVASDEALASESLTEQDSDFSIAPDGRGRPADLVEDEILLRLPNFPAHKAGTCGEAGRYLDRYLVDENAMEEAPNNPFAVLRQLKTDAGGDGGNTPPADEL